MYVPEKFKSTPSKLFWLKFVLAQHFTKTPYVVFPENPLSITATASLFHSSILQSHPLLFLVLLLYRSQSLSTLPPAFYSYIPHFLHSFFACTSFYILTSFPHQISISPSLHLTHSLYPHFFSLILSLSLPHFALLTCSLRRHQVTLDPPSSSRIPLCHSLLNPALSFSSLPLHTTHEI